VEGLSGLTLVLETAIVKYYFEVDHCQNGAVQDSETTSMSERADVLIVGTGFSSLGTAVRLKQAGVDDFIVLARAPYVEGTGRDKHRPGCACDVRSRPCSCSFEPQPEIRACLRRGAEKYGILPHIRRNANAMASRFDEASSTWVVSREGFTARCRQISRSFNRRDDAIKAKLAIHP
jgi:cation diffusion facilitator CzcD-associated flavoprotein CzcO